MNARDFIKNNNVILDGGMGTLLQEKGLMPGELPERWNITHSDIITEIHRQYFEGGSNIVCANTFGASSLKYDEKELEEIIFKAYKNASEARSLSGKENKYIALDIGPLGRLLKPLGDLDFEDAVNIFKKTVSLGVKYGYDLVIIETMADLYETKAALLAVKEASSLPVLVSCAYSENGKLMTGADPEAVVAMCEGMGADAVGANCSFGPDKLEDVIDRILRVSSVPVIFKPNAGLPESKEGKTVYNITADDFAKQVSSFVKKGVRLVGGCCGTTPEYISRLKKSIKNMPVMPITDKNLTVVSSYTHAVNIGISPILIGERLNPTGKKRLKQAIKENDMSYILNEGIEQETAGAKILDVNMGLPEINEGAVLKSTVLALQEVTSLPLQIDTSDICAMENALRIYNGKAMVNSVNGKEESMKSVFPLIKKYGGVAVALTLDENGIPDTAEGRAEIAKRILKRASEYGIAKKDIVFDTLAMTVASDSSSAKTTLEALKIIKNELGAKTSLGVSNVSYGLPNRDIINGVFFTMALNSGLDCAIMNPFSSEMMKAYYSFMTLNGMDENCTEYIDKAQSFVQAEIQNKSLEDKALYASSLQKAIIKGIKSDAASITSELLKSSSPLDIVNNEIIPALNAVGMAYENKTLFLPQLLISAECAKNAFEVIKASSQRTDNESRGDIVLATVKGDIHDIGKNIVKLLLQNYSFKVHDLGKDVDPDIIVNKVIELKAPLAGLSALMTTTVPSMEKTIRLLREKAPWCKIAVGGAVLSHEYAMSIGADKYCSDAMDTVRYAESIIKKRV